MRELVMIVVIKSYSVDRDPNGQIIIKAYLGTYNRPRLKRDQIC